MASKARGLWKYGLLVVLIAVVVISIMTVLGRKQRNLLGVMYELRQDEDGDSGPPVYDPTPAETPPVVAARWAADSDSSGSPAGQAFAATVPAAVARKVIMTGNLTLEVKEFEKVHARVVSLAKALKGYVANSQLSLPTDGVQSGTVTLRVPQEKYEEALVRLKKLGKFIDETQAAEDVTQQYVDLDARVRNLKAEEERILDIMKRAKTIKDTLAVHQRLNDLRMQVESLEGQLRYLKFQIAMATITVTLTEKATILHLPEPRWVWLNHVKSAWHAVVVFAQTLATAATYLVLFGVFWLPVVIVTLVVRRFRRRRE
jgi:hypothetical protein